MPRRGRERGGRRCGSDDGVPVTPSADRGRGDLNADLKADLVWRHLVSGANAIWTMNGNAVIDAFALPSVPTRTG